jgi:hypothetical protein
MTDPVTVPLDVRREALTAAMAGLEDCLAEHGVELDLFGRLELLDLALADLAAEYDAADTTPSLMH